MIEYLKPFCSSAETPSIVVPPGEQTESFNSAGFLPVFNTKDADPFTVWAAYRYACLRGMPHLTAASASASMKIKTKAGDDPLTAVTQSISFSSTFSTIPVDCNNSVTSDASSVVIFSLYETAIIPSLIWDGTFGIILMRRKFGANSFSLAIFIPAAIEIRTAFGGTKSLISDKTDEIILGFTAKKI